MELCLGGMAGLLVSAVAVFAPGAQPQMATQGQHGFPGP